LKILLVLENYLPVKTGGIENYTHWLACMLSRNGHQVQVAYLNMGESDNYLYEGISVIRLTNRFNSFKNLIRSNSYDICHIHEYSGKNGIDIEWFRAAKQHCKKLFFTFHLPYLACYKGDFRYNGIEDCNDFTSLERCSACVIATYLKYQRKEGFSFYNSIINSFTPVLEKSKRSRSVRENIEIRHKDLRELLDTCDDVFIYGKWFKTLLKENGYDSPALRQIPHITKPIIEKKETDNGIKKKMLFVGRIEEQKGLHLLCRAMNMVSTSGISIDVFGNIVNQEYFDQCRQVYNFNYKGIVNRMELMQLLSDYDFLVLPSVFPEMFSLIVKEAFYEQLPVIASASKGNRDAIHEGADGFIFNYDDHEDLAKVIDHAYDLKKAGWQPVFKTTASPADDEKELLSYYA